jgi:O-antigen/teichoic acid export membrane protein
MKSLEAESFEITISDDFSKKFVTNTFFNVLGRSWSFLINLLLTPYILSRLTVADFGAWVLLTILINSFNLLDLGLGFAFVRYIAAYYTYEDYESINKVLFSGLAFYSLLGILGVSGGLLIERPLLQLLRITAAGNTYFLVLLTCAVANVGAMYLSVLKGMQRMDKQNSIEITMSVLNVIGTVCFLEAGFGIFGLALNALINAVLAIGLSFVIVKRAVPKISFGWNLDRKLLREMFGYGLKISVSRIGNLICFQADKLIVSRVLGLAAVSFYEVAARLASFMRAVPLVMLSALIPATSELGARKDSRKIERTYLITSKYIAILTVAAVAFLLLDASSIVRLWLGKSFDQSAVLIQVLAIGYGANILGGAASQIGAGVGRPEFDMHSTILLSIVNPILSFLLVLRFGAPGAAAGTSIALICAAIYLLFAFHRNYLGTSLWSVFESIYIRPICSGFLAVSALLGFHYLFPGILALSETRILIPIKLAVDFVLFVPVYLLLLVALRQISVIDWNNFQWLVEFGCESIRRGLDKPRIARISIR